MPDGSVDLAGKVIDGGGSPKAGLTVSLYEAATWEAAGAATATDTTDSDGLWNFDTQDITKTWILVAVDGTKKTLIDARNKIQLTNIDIIDDISVDTIFEHTAGAGVTIDSVVLKDGGITVTADFNLDDDVDLALGTGRDALIRWSDADADNHALTVGLGDSNQALHITDKAAIATDWNVAADTHPTLYIHSNTTPATDYLKVGAHDGTTATIDVVGGTTLALAIAGTTEVNITANGIEAENAAGPAFVNEAATSTNPTLVPDKAELDTGIGWASDTLHFVLGGANEAQLTTAAFSPGASDGNALGTASLMWADLFLASGAVVNFNNGDVTLTHAAGSLAVGGGDLIVNDSDAANSSATEGWLGLGTGNDSRIYYDGTDTFWDLRGAGTGDLMIALAGSFPSPDPNAVHIWRGSAGGVSAASQALLILEDDADVSLSFLTPAGNAARINFGDSGGDAQGQLSYTHTGNTFGIRVAGVEQAEWTTGALAFQLATTISTSTGDLTLDPTASLNVTLTVDDSDSFELANDNSTYYKISTQNTVAGTNVHLIDTEDATIASGAGNIYTLFYGNVWTLNYTGTTQVTTLQRTYDFNAVSIARPEEGETLTVDKATTIWTRAPGEGSNILLVDTSAIRIRDAGGTPTNQMGIGIERQSGATGRNDAIVVGLPGSGTTWNTDADVNIVAVAVTGIPTLSWDESEDAFAFGHGLSVGGILKQNVTGTSIVAAGGIAFTDVANAWIDDATHGSGTTTHYIGNETIDTTASSREVKDNIVPVNGSAREHLETLGGLLREYDYKNGTGHFVGMVAEDVADVLPQYVVGNDSMSLRYQYMVGPLMWGWRDQEARIQALEAQVKALGGKVDSHATD